MDRWMNQTLPRTVGVSAMLGIVMAVSLGILTHTLVGEAYGRYVSEGTAGISFEAGAKPAPSVTVVDGTEQTRRSFDVIWDGAAPDTEIRVRLYGTGETAQTLRLIEGGDETYTWVARRLDPHTVMGTELEAEWVYVLTDVNGAEVLFSGVGEALHLTVASETDMSALLIRAEAVRK